MYHIKYSKQEVAAAISRIAAETKVSDNSVLLVVMNGGVWFSHQLMCKLQPVPSEVEYVKLSSYKGFNRGKISQDYLPDTDFAGKDVIVVDDICDSGATLNMIDEWLKSLRPASVQFRTLISRKGYQLNEGMDFKTGIEDDSQDFFAGCGMDGGINADMEFRYISAICVIEK